MQTLVRRVDGSGGARGNSSSIVVGSRGRSLRQFDGLTGV